MQNGRKLWLESLEDRTVPTSGFLSGGSVPVDQIVIVVEVQPPDPNPYHHHRRHHRSDSEGNGRDLLTIETSQTDGLSNSVTTVREPASRVAEAVTTGVAPLAQPDNWMLMQRLSNEEAPIAPTTEAPILIPDNAEPTEVALVQSAPMPLENTALQSMGRRFSILLPESTIESTQVHLTTELPEFQTEHLPGMNFEQALPSGEFAMPWESQGLKARSGQKEKQERSSHRMSVLPIEDEVVGLGEQRRDVEDQSNEPSESGPNSDSTDAEPIDLFWQEVRRAIFVLPFLK